MVTSDYSQTTKLNTVNPEEMTEEQRTALVSRLATYDSEQFIQNQGQAARVTISNIKKHQTEFDKKGEKFAESQLSEYLKKHPKQKILN